MIKKGQYILVLLGFVVFIGCLLAHLAGNDKPVIDRPHHIGRPPRIRPDYHGTVIPPNIAPLNFLIQEDGLLYYVKIYSPKGKPIEVVSKSPKIIIPDQSWRRLLSTNRGEQIAFDIFVKAKDGKWTAFSTLTSSIASEPIEDYLVYRKIHPAHGVWKEIGVYQRDLQTFDETIVLDNRYFKRGCLNCHAFCNNRTDKMLIGIRSEKYGSSAVLAEDGTVSKIGTKFGYTSWHPSGRLAAYSVNYVGQFFHSAREEVRDVIDLDSFVAYYSLDSETVKTSPDLSKKDRLETYPAWSPDGRYLYFCSAPIWWADRKRIIPEQYDQIKYDLLRIRYDIDRDQWGPLETILSAHDTGLSILEPRISPDGRWLLFCMCNYGCFPVYQQSSDLYLMDLKAASQTGQYKYRRLNINSDQSESWHSWASNSRWIAFSSKRDFGVFTRIYFSYVDQTGRVYKPILMPQKDPTFYDSCLNTYSVPELITQPVRVTGEKLGQIVRSKRRITVDMPITMATPTAGPQPASEPWQQRE
ncbi:MAG: TolB family protein [Planctomycetota bacterium]|jgi:hypothetical protein